MELDVGNAVHLPAGGGDIVRDVPESRLEILSDRDELHATWTRFGPHRDGASPHVHRQHSDLFYVLEGEFTVFVGAGRTDHVLPAGTLALAPPLVVHGFRNASDGERQVPQLPRPRRRVRPVPPRRRARVRFVRPARGRRPAPRGRLYRRGRGGRGPTGPARLAPRRRGRDRDRGRDERARRQRADAAAARARAARGELLLDRGRARVHRRRRGAARYRRLVGAGAADRAAHVRASRLRAGEVRQRAHAEPRLRRLHPSFNSASSAGSSAGGCSSPSFGRVCACAAVRRRQRFA